MYEAWIIKLFHSWKHSDWFGDEHMTQIGPVSTKTGALAGVSRQTNVLFPLVLEPWGYKSETVGGHLAITEKNLPENRAITKEGRARGQTRPSASNII